MKNYKKCKNYKCENTGDFPELVIPPEYIKKTLRFKDSDVLHINIKYPDIKIMPSVLYKKAGVKINGFYLSAVKKFVNFCEKKLYKSAALDSVSLAENFKPFGAVVTYEVAYNQQDYLCVYLDINIYSGKGRGNNIRKAHIWKLSEKSIELLPPGKHIKDA